MRTREEVQSIVGELCAGLRKLFPGEEMDVILFGSYARETADDGSDIDVMILLDAPRPSLAEKNWQVGEIAAELLLEHGVLVSPIVENREYFEQNVRTLPFFRSIQTEGVKISA